MADLLRLLLGACRSTDAPDSTTLGRKVFGESPTLSRIDAETRVISLTIRNWLMVPEACPTASALLIGWCVHPHLFCRKRQPSVPLSCPLARDSPFFCAVTVHRLVAYSTISLAHLVPIYLFMSLSIEIHRLLRHKYEPLFGSCTSFLLRPSFIVVAIVQHLLASTLCILLYHIHPSL